MPELSKHERRLQRQEEKKRLREEQSTNTRSAAKKEKFSNYIIAALAVAIAVVFFTNSGSGASAYPTADDDPSIGSMDAPIEIIAFGDMECPFTRRWALTTLVELTEKHGDNIRIVYRDFPKYDKHKFAETAAAAADCAGDQGKYWEYFRKVFEMQPAFSRQALKTYAVEIGLDSAAFNECLDSGKYTSEVRKDRADGEKAGVITTPTFFINGNKIEGAQNLAAFDYVIEQLLA